MSRKPLGRVEGAMATKPYRDDPSPLGVAESSSGSLTYRRTSPNSPIMELEMHPINNSSATPESSPNRSSSSGNKCGLKLCWTMFVVLVCFYAITRYEAAPEEDKAQPPLSAPTTESSPTKKVQNADAVKQKKDGTSKTSTICSRVIPFDLFDYSTWPTPFTNSQFIEKPVGTLLIRKEDTQLRPNRIRSITEFFSAIDMAYEKKYRLFVTKDADWVWDALLPPFFADDVERNDEFWDSISSSLDVAIVDDESNVDPLGKDYEIFSSRNPYVAQSLTAVQIRDRRDTIFRLLMRLSSPTLHGESCFTISLCGLAHVSEYPKISYTVIDLSPEMTKPWQSKFNQITGKDHSGAYQMTPEYVKSILKPLNLHTKSIFLMGDHSATEDEEIKRLMDDPELITQPAVQESDDYSCSDMFHLAVLADVYMGNPIDKWSLLIARVRFALGFSNTFVLTESKIDENGNKQWMSYVDKDNYLELYDREHLGSWMG